MGRPETFREQELAGWNAKAGAYDKYAGRITVQIVEALLNAARVVPKAKLLDIACGPGYLAGAAAERGAEATGLDFAPSMVAEAQKNFPRARFRKGDAEALPFESNSFDAVVCGFGIGHLPDPDKALREAFRTLRPGGSYALSWWCGLDKHDFFALVMGAVKAHGKLDVALPAAPPMFRFSEPPECEHALLNAGFSNVKVQEHALHFELRTPQDALDLLKKSSVRIAMVLELQTKQALADIHQAILVGVQKYNTVNAFRIGWPALVASGTKTSR
jgi:SAM-dependent methyltransferase